MGKRLRLKPLQNSRRRWAGTWFTCRQRALTRKKDGRFAITMKDAGKNLQKLLGKAGAVESVDVRPASLNDVFIKYTGKSIREEEAAGDYWTRVANVNKND